MRKVFCAVSILVLVLGFCFVSRYTNTYSMRGVVTGVKGQIVTLTDETGNVWQIDSEGFKKGSIVRIRWFNNGSDMYRLDDKIIEVKVVK